MTVKDIFELRKQGKIEEAYEAIKPMYAVHKGKYTTLCMFWTARDIFNKRMAEGRIEEAAKIYKALQRVLPNIDDTEGNATAFMQYAARALASIAPSASPTATAPAGSPAVPPAATAPASSVLAGSASSFSSLHFSGEFAPAQTGSPACPVPSASPASSVLTGSAGEINPSCSVLSDSVAEALNPGQQSVLDCIKAHEGINVPRISEATNIPSKSIERHISVLIERNLIEHRGSKKTGGYYAK
ncbi:MAG: helix-turn-helix transcriptional regulator [Bacteroidaceae bacterium]|nr:helix-turn-helix transcriptional regulator [Bacteroidaceae bacterium]